MPKKLCAHYLQKSLDVKTSDAFYLISDKNFGHCERTLLSKSKLFYEIHGWENNTNSIKLLHISSSVSTRVCLIKETKSFDASQNFCTVL